MPCEIPLLQLLFSIPEVRPASATVLGKPSQQCPPQHLLVIQLHYKDMQQK